MQSENTTKEPKKNKLTASILTTPSQANNTSTSNTTNENNSSVEKQLTLTGANSDKINAAILIGVSDYGSQSTNLPQCENDISLIKEVVTKIKNPSYILYISGNCTGQEAADKIISFFRDIKEKEEKIDELLFYFTGHGIAHEKNNGEIESRLVFSDYASNRINQTTVSSEFIDNQARSISPNTYVKIIDSCYSGSKIIKGNIEQREKFLNELSKDEKHYTNVGFNSVYVMASSRSDQVSFANSKFSDFSESLLLSLYELPGDVKYRHIVNRLADDFTSKEQRPVFVTQGSLDEGFGIINQELKDYIYNKLTTEETTNTKDNKSKNNSEEQIIKELSQKIKEKTSTKLFSKSDFHEFLNLVHEKSSILFELLSPFYDVEIEASEKQIVPNEVFIGNWLKNNSHSYFARVRYRKPESDVSRTIASRIINTNIDSFQSNTKPISTNNIEESQPIIGFTPVGMVEDAEVVNSRVREIKLTPKEDMKILDSILIHIVIINSQERVALFTSIESCPLIDWDRYSRAKCPLWKVHEIKSAKRTPEISSELDTIFNSMKLIALALITSKSLDQEKNSQEN